MCGITGVWSHRCTAEERRNGVAGMACTLEHRGPDQQGVWSDDGAGVSLGHRRLSIIDLSPQGSQPMVSGSGRYVMVYNGEVYNHADLRAELEGTPGVAAFRGHSDTEVMLAAIERWGLDAAVQRFIGMFAFALWDRSERTLHLVRDRVGIKPLYYAWRGGAFLFGSELRALRSYAGPAWEVDRDALALLLRYGAIPAPLTIYRGVRKLPPGSILSLGAPAVEVQPRRYWSAREVVESARAHPFRGSPSEAVDELDRLLRDAVRLRMVADVPLGAFLSGGVDSSTVVALMQAQSERPVNTFAIGYHEKEFDEARHAREVARHLGTSHTELFVTSDEAAATVPRMAEIFDEPFADASQVPTYLVSALARRHVVVSLSGDGGDELFAGYNRHVWGERVWGRAKRVPHPLRSAIARAVRSIPQGTWDRGFEGISPLLPPALRVRTPGHKLHKLAGAISSRTPLEMYHRLASQWSDPVAVVIGAQEPPTAATDPGAWADVGSLPEQMMYLDTVSYLPDDILTKVDRASMAVSLEARVPILDHRVVELAWRLPLDMKLRDGASKWVLRQVLYRYVPRELIERPKSGFAVPLGDWLRGPLRGWAEALLDESRLRQEGYFRPGPVLDAWRMHLRGSGAWEHPLWTVLMFQAWLERQGSVPAGLAGAGCA